MTWLVRMHARCLLLSHMTRLESVRCSSISNEVRVYQAVQNLMRFVYMSLHLWHDSCICARGVSSLRVTWLAFGLHVALLYLMRFVYMSLRIRHDSFTYARWLFLASHMARLWSACRFPTFKEVRVYVCSCNMARSYPQGGSFFWVAWLFWVKNLSFEFHESFFPVTWLIFSLHPALTCLMWIVSVCSHMTWLAFGLPSCICLFVYVPRMSFRACLFIYVSSYLSLICLFVHMSLRICSKIHWSSIKFFFVRDINSLICARRLFLSSHVTCLWSACSSPILMRFVYMSLRTWHDSFIYARRLFLLSHVTRLWSACSSPIFNEVRIHIFVCDMTHLYARDDSFFWVTRLRVGLHIALIYSMRHLEHMRASYHV